jgi:hypothetical protein
MFGSSPGIQHAASFATDEMCTQCTAVTQRATWLDAVCIHKLVVLHDELLAAVKVGKIDEFTGVFFVVCVAAVHHHNQLNRCVMSLCHLIPVGDAEVL